MLEINSEKDLLISLYNWKNSIGRNSKNIATKKIIKPQNKLCPDQDVILLSVIPKASINKYIEKPSKLVPIVKKYKLKMDLN